MDSVKILKEEFEKAGLILAEEAAMKVVVALKASLTRMSVEASEAAVKSMAPVGLLVLTALDGEIKKLIDFNKDSKIGE